MRRREFITLLGGAAAGWPLKARAQQTSLPVIGFLNAQSPAEFAHLVAAFRRGLNDAGFSEGDNVAVEYRWGERDFARLPSLAADLVRGGPAVLVATGGAHAAGIAASKTIPIICTFGGDPVKPGFVESINRPGKNVTGVMVLTADLEAKRLELLHELVPTPGSFGILFDPTFPDAGAHLKEVESASRTLGREIRVANASTESEIDKALAALVQWRITGLAVGAGPLFYNRRKQIITLAAQHRMPAIYENRETALAGGLMSYGVSVPGVYRQIGYYAGRVLKGERPAELPIEQPSKFELVINLKSANALGLNIPPMLLARADEVIE